MRGFYYFPLIFILNSMEIKVNILQKLSTWLQNCCRLIFIFILTLVLYFLAFNFNFIFGYFKKNDLIWVHLPNMEESFILLFISPIFLAPIIETFLGQSLPYYLLNKVKYLQRRKYLILIASGLFFGLLHFYSLFYIIYAFFLGLVLMYGYMVRIKTDKKTFLLIAICHSLLNLGIFIINLY